MSMNFARVLGAIISLNSDLLSLPSVVASGRKHQAVNQDLEALFKAEIYEQNKTEQYTQTNCCGCEQCFYGAPRLESDLPFSGRQNGLRINDWFDPEEAKKSQGGLLAAAGESGSSDEARRTLEAVLVSIPPKTHTNDTDSEGSVVTFLDHHGSATTSMNAGDDKDDFLFSDGSSVAVLIDDEKSDFSRQVAEHHHQTQTELHQFSVKDDLTGCITQGACKPPTLFDSGVFKCNTKDLIPKPLTKSQLTPDVRFAKATFCEKEAPTICQNPYSKPLTTSTGGIAVAAAARMALPLIAPEYHMAAQTGAFLMGAFTADKLGRNTSDVRIYKVDMGSSWMSGLVGKNEFAVSTVSVPSGLQFYVKNNAFTPIKTLSIEEQVKLQAGDGDGKDEVDEVEDVTPKEKRSKKKGSRNAKSGNQMVDEVGAEAGSGLQLQKFAKKSDLISGLFNAGMHSLGLTKSGNEDSSTNDGDSKKTVPSVSDENDDSIEQVDLVERPLNDQAQPTVGITLNSGSMSTFKSIPYLAAGRLDFDHTRISSNSLVVAKIKVPVVDARSVVGESQFSGFDYYRRMSEHVRTRISLKLAKEALKRTKKSSVESLASDDILNEIEMANISMKLREATKAERDRERKRFRQEQEKAKEDAEASKDDCEDCGGCDDCEDEAAADPNQPAPPPDPKKDPTYDAGAIYTIEMEFSGKFSARKVARASSKSSESDDDGQSELDFQKTILTFPVRMDDVDGRYYRLKKKGEALRILEEPTFSWDKEVVVGLHWTDYLVRWYIGEDEKNLKMVQAAKAVDTSLGAISAANKFYQRLKNRFRGTDSEDNDDTDKLASRHATFSRQSFGFLGGDRYLTFDTQVVAPKKDRNMTTFLGSLARYLSSNPPKGHTFNEAVILSKKKTQIGYQDDDLFDRPLASSRITRSSQNAKKARKTTLLENDGTNKDAKKSKKIHSDAVAADDDIRNNFKPLYNQGLEKSRIRATLLNLSIFKPALGGSELLSNWVGRNDDRECCCDTMCNFCCCTFPSLCGHFCCVIPTQKIICYDQTVEECCCGCGGCTQECCARECCCCDEDEICGPEKPPPPPDVSQAGFPAIVVGAATGKTYEHHHQGFCLASDIQVWDSGKLYLDVLLDYTGRNAYEFRNGISLNREKANNLWLGHSKGMQFSKSCMICIVDMMECALVKCKFQCINKDAPDCRKCVRNTCQRHKDKYKDPYTHSYVDGGVGSNQRLTFEMCTGFITREEIESIDGQQRLA